MHTEISTPAPTTNTSAPATITAQTADEKLERAHRLVSNAFRHTDDESISALTWSDHDEIGRQLAEAMRLMKEATTTEGRTN